MKGFAPKASLRDPPPFERVARVLRRSPFGRTGEYLELVKRFAPKAPFRETTLSWWPDFSEGVPSGEPGEYLELVKGFAPKASLRETTLSWWPDLNWRPADYESAALPLSYTSFANDNFFTFYLITIPFRLVWAVDFNPDVFCLLLR